VSWDNAVALIVAVALVGYLLAAMIFPERF
jgi:K+-transporting ATPase KdpF subunit